MKTNGIIPSSTSITTLSCNLCGCQGATIRCDLCQSMILCVSCDDMYHRHPKRKFHVRKTVNVDTVC